MELKVHVDNTIRTVCGLTQDTTVEEIIKALVHSIKQTGRFILIENFQTTKPHNRRLPRIMSPDERPIEIIFTYLRYLDNDEDIEFHLIRTDEHLDERQQRHQFLLKKINERKKCLEQQNSKIENLSQEIRDYEVTNMNLTQKAEVNTNELVKRKILILDLKNCLNEKKLNKLETNKEDVDETLLNKEIELNLFLIAQHDYYKRKLDLAEMNFKTLETDYERLKQEYNFLIESLPEFDYCDAHDSRNQIARDCEESTRQYDLNNAKLNYLETSTFNLEESLRSKNVILQNLEADLQNLIKCENNINNIKLNENNSDLYDSGLLESSSSECISDDDKDSKESLNYGNNYKPAREYTINSVSQRYSRIRRLNRNYKSPANVNRNTFNYEDIHHF